MPAPSEPHLAYATQRQRAQMPPKPAAVARMPKAQALAIVKTLKRWTLATSLGSFLVLGIVVANNATHSSAAQATDSNSSSGTSTSSSSSDSSSSSNYFSQSGGYSFGSSSSLSQGAVSGSSSS